MANVCYLYSDNCDQMNNVERELNNYASMNNITFESTIKESMSTKMHWNKRDIGQWFTEQRFNAGDTVIAYQAADMARSTCQMLEILVEATKMQVNIFFLKYDETFYAKETNKLEDLLCMMQHIESDFISRRTTDALARRRAAGLPLGRPKGRKNKSLKLDRFKKDIMKYLDLGISKASIAKLVNCHPQTLYDWIDRHGITDKRARKSRSAQQETNEMAEEFETA